jgi:hypothetical protein
LPKNQQGRVGQGTKKNYRAGQDTGYQNSSRAGYRLQKYLNLQSSNLKRWNRFVSEHVSSELEIFII